MPWVRYDSHIRRQYTGNAIDVLVDTLKIMLLSSSYTPDQTNHDFADDLIGEVSGTGYTAGGLTLTGKSATVVAHILTFDCDDITITQSGAGFANARWAVLKKDTGSAATSPLIAYHDLGSVVGNVAGNLKLQTPSGVFTT